MSTVPRVESNDFEIPQIEEIEEKESFAQEKSTSVSKIALIGIACLAVSLAVGSVLSPSFRAVTLAGLALTTKALIITAIVTSSVAFVSMLILDHVFQLGINGIRQGVNEGINGIRQGIEQLIELSNALGLFEPDDGIEKTCVYSSEAAAGIDDEIIMPVFVQIDIKDVIGKDVSVKGIEKVLKASQAGKFANGRVKGIVLNIDSPGGGAKESHLIYRAIKEYKKKYQIPVYAFVEGNCCSGGFYIACAADKIYASKISIIGSVGVIGGSHFNYKGLMEHLGIESKTFSAGENKDEMNPFRSWDHDEGKGMKKIYESCYDTFVDVVVKNREQISREKLTQEYGAGVFPTKEAKEYGYIDEIKSYRKTVQDIARTAHLDETQPYQVIELKVKSSVLDRLSLSDVGLNSTAKPEVNYL